jgi:hypothetical protein
MLEFQQKCTANIMQNLQSNGDAFSAVADSLGGATDLEVRNNIQNRMEQNMNIQITNQMNASIVANQQFIVSESNSVYSAGISQQLMLDCTVTVLVANDFANKMLSDSKIDQYTNVRNDQNTLQAALDAIEQVNHAFQSALTTNAGLLSAFISILAIAGTVILICVVLQASADSMKRQLSELCPERKYEASTTKISGTIGGKKIDINVPVVTL